MGGSCCHAESPCGSTEETSGLLKDDSRVTVPTGGADVVGTCGPEVDDVIRLTPDDGNIKVEVKVKQSPEGGETVARNTQENGVLQEAVTQTAAASPRKESEVQENSAGAQEADVKDRPADAGPAEPLLTPQEDHTAAEWQVVAATNTAGAAEEEEEGNKASPQGKILDISLLTSEAARPENHTEPKAAREPVTARDTKEEAESKVPPDSAAAAEPSGETSQDNQVLPVVNTQLAAAAACQVLSAAAASQEISKESASCVVSGGSESPAEREEAGAEALRSHDGPECPAGSEPAGLGGEDQDSANCVLEPETTALADASESSKSGLDPEPGPECAPAVSKEVASLENVVEETMLKGPDKDEDAPKAEEENNEAQEEAAGARTDTQAGRDAQMDEKAGDEEPAAARSSAGVKADERSATEREDSAEDGLGNSEEDLYRGLEELSPSEENRAGPPPASETTLLKVEDRRSLAPAIDILSYSEREWKGNTAKSALIRKGYKEMSQRFGSLRRVRGDNYCALRATLFQVLSHSPQLPEWLQEDDITMLPKQLEAQEGLISRWMFPGECLQGDGTGDAILQLKGYVELLREKWRAAVGCPSASERRQLCERLFQGGEEELGLLEALKLLMLGRAAELHGCMRAGGDVPLFCWLLFARDSSDCPRSFLCNHLSHVGLSAGLEQVEMFLLGYALQCTIQVYRLYKADTEEFVTYYPDDHKDDWPSVCLVTEDDRHYNVPIVEATEPKELDASS